MLRHLHFYWLIHSSYTYTSLICLSWPSALVPWNLEPVAFWKFLGFLHARVPIADLLAVALQELWTTWPRLKFRDMHVWTFLQISSWLYNLKSFLDWWWQWKRTSHQLLQFFPPRLELMRRPAADASPCCKIRDWRWPHHSPFQEFPPEPQCG